MFETIDSGFVSLRQAGTATAVAAGPRTVMTTGGDVLCSFLVQSALGVNDFTLMLARSHDLGKTWSEQGTPWPHLTSRLSMFGSLSKAPSGELFLYGIATPIDQPGESFWSDAAQGLKQNFLFWSRSADDGRTWSEPERIPMPYPGSAEAPGPLCVTRDGAWLVCYAPYNTFDPAIQVKKDHIVVLRSEDQGATWSPQSMIRFDDPSSNGAEAWVIELPGSRLLGACWHIATGVGKEYPNPYTMSLDGGKSWLPARSTGIVGQSVGLAALPDGRALMVYNQRRHGETGVWLALANPTPQDFRLEANEIVWRAQTTTQKGTSGEHAEWTDFSFGEPSVTILPDGNLLVALWCVQPAARGIAFVRLRMAQRAAA